jgi:hypothetical protein
MPTVRSSKLKLFVVAVAISVGLFFGAGALAQDAPISGQPSTKLEAWQNRRSERLKLLKDAQIPNAEHSAALDQMLTNFEKHPLAQTPVENLELIGLFYARREGIAKALSLIVMNATLGWYDVLRYGSPSGQAEIVNNEMFFKRAFVLAGKARVDEYLGFAKSHPDEIQAEIVHGLALAEKFKDSNEYDRKWPTAYGLERSICALGGACTDHAEAAQAQWNNLWDQAKTRIEAYYKVQ